MERALVTFRFVKGVVAWLLGRRPRGSGPFRDPHAGVREPRRRRPGGRGSAAAVMEPEPDHATRAIGRQR